MKKYLITCSTQTNGNNVFIDTYLKLKDSFDYRNYQMKPYWRTNVSNSTIILIDRPFRSHCDRWLHFNLDNLENGYVFFLDTSDVLFQAPVQETLVGDVIVTSENVIHDGEPNGGSFWRQWIKPNTRYEKLMDKTIYNAGSFAMRTEVFREWIAYMKKTLENEPYPPFDQHIFNYFLHFELKGKIVENTKIMMCGYKNIETRRMKKKDDLWLNEQDEVISICHFNGNSKQYESIFDSKLP